MAGVFPIDGLSNDEIAEFGKKMLRGSQSKTIFGTVNDADLTGMSGASRNRLGFIDIGTEPIRYIDDPDFPVDISVRCRRALNTKCIRPSSKAFSQNKAKRLFDKGLTRVFKSKSFVQSVKAAKGFRKAISSGGRFVLRSAQALPAGPLEVALAAINAGIVLGEYVPKWQSESQRETLIELPKFFAELLGSDPDSDFFKHRSIAAIVANEITKEIAWDYIEEDREQLLNHCSQCDKLDKEMSSREIDKVIRFLRLPENLRNALYPNGMGLIETKKSKLYIDCEDPGQPVFIISQLKDDGSEWFKEAGVGADIVAVRVHKMRDYLRLALGEEASMTYLYQKYVYQEPETPGQYAAFGRMGAIPVDDNHRMAAASRNKALKATQEKDVDWMLSEPSEAIYNSTLTYGYWATMAEELGANIPSRNYQDYSEPEGPIKNHPIGQARQAQWEQEQIRRVAAAFERLSPLMPPVGDINKLVHNITSIPAGVMVASGFGAEPSRANEGGDGREKRSFYEKASNKAAGMTSNLLGLCISFMAMGVRGFDSGLGELEKNYENQQQLHDVSQVGNRFYKCWKTEKELGLVSKICGSFAVQAAYPVRDIKRFPRICRF